ncbi:unnamed protein product [Protopolystoma xenopodis]|uniref:Uncharacterized protein n=1 Tax=Protopolystoma xenopodis TaxID=117903 RepID=A0A448XGQ6_9PLAT|nr:unnamed protein product [Protopolystoma xenopodis]
MTSSDFPYRHAGLALSVVLALSFSLLPSTPIHPPQKEAITVATLLPFPNKIVFTSCRRCGLGTRSADWEIPIVNCQFRVALTAGIAWPLVAGRSDATPETVNRRPVGQRLIASLLPPNNRFSSTLGQSGRPDSSPSCRDSSSSRAILKKGTLLTCLFAGPFFYSHEYLLNRSAPRLSNHPFIHLHTRPSPTQPTHSSIRQSIDACEDMRTPRRLCSQSVCVLPTYAHTFNLFASSAACDPQVGLGRDATSCGGACKNAWAHVCKGWDRGGLESASDWCRRGHIQKAEMGSRREGEQKKKDVQSVLGSVTRAQVRSADGNLIATPPAPPEGCGGWDETTALWQEGTVAQAYRTGKRQAFADPTGKEDSTTRTSRTQHGADEVGPSIHIHTHPHTSTHIHTHPHPSNPPHCHGTTCRLAYRRVMVGLSDLAHLDGLARLRRAMMDDDLTRRKERIVGHLHTLTRIFAPRGGSQIGPIVAQREI